ncbi:MAG: RagB/SusD family nutrient uptake outer membrane protein [Prevotella sp.]|nr:RagB/SusD family nutrient uptake outer membrane protein [Prevotella sp.]
MITKSINKILASRLAGPRTLLACCLVGCATSAALTSCEDFFEQESDHVIYSDADHLTAWSDTVYSVMGILSKLQAVADRTILLGEVRADLVSLTAEASNDLRQLATFDVSDDNQYNQPRDYYAVINNCNYFIAHADTALKSNRNEYIFMKEYAAVKAIRAWTYLQLALNYGSVPFVTEPILTKEESERSYPNYSLQDICEFFLQDLATLPARYDNEYPNYGDNVRGNHSRLFFFPLNIVRGDLNLYLGSIKGTDAGKLNFQQAAICYFNYISGRNGLNSYYPTTPALRMWTPGSSSWTNTYTISSGTNFNTLYMDESYGANSEFITMIPGDSIRAEGNYSELRNLFYSRDENNQKVSISPSKRVQEISESQVNCCLSSNGLSASYAPNGLSEHRTGDLRLATFWQESYDIDDATGLRVETQYLTKYLTRNVHIYRRQMVYLRLAEALNWAGQPLVAFKILQRGLTDEVLANEVYPYVSESDSIWVASNLSFPDAQYKVLEAEDVVSNSLGSKNTVGIHTRGSGWTPKNEFYTITCASKLPAIQINDSTFVFDEQYYQQVKLLQQQQVDSLIINESALECAFEGTRFYDLMRYCLRQPDPGLAMDQFVTARRGQANADAVRSELKKSLRQPSNWYLNWNGRLGIVAP